MSGKSADERSKKLRRRRFIQSAGAATLAGLAGCGGGAGSTESSTQTGDGGDGPSPSEGSPLKVEFFGGVFKEVMDEHLVKPFEEDTGIPVESSAGVSAQDTLKLQSAVQADEAPIDLVVASPVNRIRGQRLGIWHNYDPGELTRSDIVLEDLRPTTDDGQIVGAGAFGWFATLVSQTDIVDEPLSSWSVYWDDQYQDSLGISSDYDAGILDITARMFFDGPETMQTEDGLTDILEKVSEIKSQVSLWYDGEAEPQQALLDENLTASWLFHDVTLVMEEEGQPVESVFPEEGALQNDGAWVILDSTDYPDEAIEFIDYSLRPDVQKRITENLYTAPVIQESELDMSEDLYSRVYGPGPEASIRPSHEVYLDNEEFLSQKWRELIQ
jgi:putative spermidine/putrescine transport system substrate-binding protein